MESFGKPVVGRIHLDPKAKLASSETSMCGTCRTDDKTSIQYCKCCGKRVIVIREQQRNRTAQVSSRAMSRRRDHIRRVKRRERTQTLIAGKRAFITYRLRDQEPKTQAVLHSTRISFQNERILSSLNRNLVKLKKSNGQSNIRYLCGNNPTIEIKNSECAN
jgi:hypothetical protein